MFFNTGYRERKNKPGFHLVGDNWNDYGFYTLFRAFYVNEDLEEIDLGYVKIGYKGQGIGAVSLENSFESLPDEYFSLGQSSSYYSELKKLGDTIRIDCLNNLKDVAYNLDIYKEVEDEEVFKTSLMREINQRVFEKQFTRIAKGGAILTDYEFEYHISESKEPNVKFEFKVMPELLPPTNIHAIIGTNGAGKTTSLKGIIQEYMSGNLSDNFANTIFISFSVFDKNPIYEADTQGKEYYYVGVKKNTSESKSYQDLKQEFSESIFNIFSKKRVYYLHRMLEILNTDFILNSFALIDIIEEYISTNQSNEKAEEYSVLLADKFINLSSGHQIILLSVAKIVELIVEQSLILIDEPETHLHPPLLSAFIRAISELIIAENGVAILATHSPIVLQEVPKSCVSIIRKHGNFVKIDRPRFETFGENVGILTEEIFGLEIRNTGFHSLLKKEVEKYRDYDEVVKSFSNELSIEAKSLIRTYINELNKEGE